MSDISADDTTCREYQRRIFAAMNYISEHATENLSLNDIAQRAYFSKYHFHRLFKAFSGETVADFTRRVRLEKTANLLILDAQISITDIALDYGFSSAQNFAKQFTKQFGQSPGFFRQKNNKSVSLALLDKHKKTAMDVLFDHAKIDRMGVKVIPTPFFKLAYKRFIKPYRSHTTKNYIQELLTSLASQHVAGYEIIGIAWDNPDITDDVKCRYDIGVKISKDMEVPDNLSVQEFPDSVCAVYRCEVTNNDLEEPWDDLITTWLPFSGYILTGSPGYEIFRQYDLNNPESPWLLEIHLPVKTI